jgi:hypothetical protein
MCARSRVDIVTGVLVAALALSSAEPCPAGDAVAGQLSATGEVASIAPAAGSAGGLLFSDDFSFSDAGWSLFDAEISGGALIHAPKPGAWSNAFYFGSLFEDADVRVRARIVSTSDRAETAVSLAFWHADGKNLYAFTFWPETAFLRVTRFQDGRGIAVVERKVEGFAPGPDGSFELGVATTANVAAIFIDGRELARFKGQPPEGGWKLGTFAGAPKSGAANVAFSDLRVKRP